jgi:hypothetical protein
MNGERAERALCAIQFWDFIQAQPRRPSSSLPGLRRCRTRGKKDPRDIRGLPTSDRCGWEGREEKDGVADADAVSSSINRG